MLRNIFKSLFFINPILLSIVAFSNGEFKLATCNNSLYNKLPPTEQSLLYFSHEAFLYYAKPIASSIAEIADNA